MNFINYLSVAEARPQAQSSFAAIGYSVRKEISMVDSGVAPLAFLHTVRDIKRAAILFKAVSFQSSMLHVRWYCKWKEGKVGHCEINWSEGSCIGFMPFSARRVKYSTSHGLSQLFEHHSHRMRTFIRADFWEGDATKHLSLKKRGFQWKGGRQFSESGVW